MGRRGLNCNINQSSLFKENETWQPQPGCTGEQLLQGKEDLAITTKLPMKPCFGPKFPKEHMVKVVALGRTQPSWAKSHVLGPTSLSNM